MLTADTKRQRDTEFKLAKDLLLPATTSLTFNAVFCIILVPRILKIPYYYILYK